MGNTQPSEMPEAPPPKDETLPTKEVLANLPEYDLDEVSKHIDTSTGVWIIIDNLIYDVTKFLGKHPGGAGLILPVAGMDCTDEFEAAMHTIEARQMRKDFLIGKLATKNVIQPSTQQLMIPKGKPKSKSQSDTTKDAIQTISFDLKAKPLTTTTPTDKQSMNPKKQSILASKQSKDLKKIGIFYASQKGRCRKFANDLLTAISESISPSPELHDLAQFDAEDLHKFGVILCIVCSWQSGKPPQTCDFFFTHLQSLIDDCRVHSNSLKSVKFGIFGAGNSLYEDDYNRVAIDLDATLRRLGAKSLGKDMRLRLGDNNVSRDDNGTIESDFESWQSAVVKRLKATVTQPSIDGNDDGLAEIEDMGAILSQQLSLNNKPNITDDIADTEQKSMDESVTNDDNGVKREMVTPKIRETLTKQGYKVIGSHSGVKLCRWTKAMLRGRGGCYKHTFYGIMSYQCMEMTPSLACANKCEFCWRHHSHPVGKQWNWQMDDAEFIVKEALSKHGEMIRTMRGVPGVLPERFEEAQRVQHCALSLVGEPIMYPRINDVLRLLHRQQISTFLVTNAQFPDAMRKIDCVTQLYVSVDASNPAALKKIDRPLFKDFWERFVQCLDALRDKQQRTVYRMTLVKGEGYNMSGISDYARLVSRGQPSFIEVKGVTFCGKSEGSNIRMSNIPFHFEVKSFCEKLVSYLGGDYELACEHEHSCCCLIAHKQFKIDGHWHTWIDYPKFHKCVQSGKHFTALDYAAKTPHWGIWNAKEGGFNPGEDTEKYLKKLEGRKKAAAKVFSNQSESN